MLYPSPPLILSLSHVCKMDWCEINACYSMICMYCKKSYGAWQLSTFSCLYAFKTHHHSRGLNPTLVYWSSVTVRRSSPNSKPRLHNPDSAFGPKLYDLQKSAIEQSAVVGGEGGDED